ADSRIVNSRWLVEADRASGQASGAGVYRLTEGLGRLLDVLLDARGTVPPILRTNSIVSEIRWQPGEVHVELQSPRGAPPAPLSAAHAVVTVPLGVLMAASGSPAMIRFIPDLPEKWKSGSFLRMGSVVK